MPSDRCRWRFRLSRPKAKYSTKLCAVDCPHGAPMAKRMIDNPIGDELNSDLAEPLHFEKANCLVLACGNTLRSDDGIGLRLAEWAAERFRDDGHVRVVARQQWTPDLAKDIAGADSVLFVD